MATAQDMLTAVESAITARLEGGAVQSYSINGRNIQYISLGELYKLREQLRREVNGARSATDVKTYASFERPA